jgi:hypothetical protein
MVFLMRKKKIMRVEQKKTIMRLWALVVLILLAWAVTMTVLYTVQPCPLKPYEAYEAAKTAVPVPESKTAPKYESLMRAMTDSLLETEHADYANKLRDYWRMHKPNFDSIVLDGRLTHSSLVIYEFKTGVVRMIRAPVTADVELDKAGPVLELLQLLAQRHPEWSGRICFITSDLPVPTTYAIPLDFPMFTWNTFTNADDNGLMLSIDPYFIRNYLDDKFPATCHIPPAEKIPTAVFRGNTTSDKRLWAVQKYIHHPQIDIKFSKYTSSHFREEHREYFGDFMNVEEQCRYRYLINMDGYGAAWDRTEWQLRSNSVMFLDTQFKMFTTLHLKPHRHYIPFSMTETQRDDDLSSQLELVQKMSQVDVNELVANAQEYAAIYNNPIQAFLFMEQVVKHALDIYNDASSEKTVVEALPFHG